MMNETPSSDTQEIARLKAELFAAQQAILEGGIREGELKAELEQARDDYDGACHLANSTSEDWKRGKAELAQATQREQRLREALEALCHEVACALYMRPHNIRQVIGNINFACLENRKQEAEHVLTETKEGG